MRRTVWVILSMMLVMGSADAFAQSHYATKQAQESYDSGIKLERRAEEKGDASYLKEAEEKYREAIAAEPNMVQAYVRLGYVLYAEQKSAEGVKVMHQALERHPDNIELKHYLGLNQYQAGQSELAEATLTAVVAQRQDLPEAYFVLGKINLDKGDFLNAQEYFSQYAAMTPNDAHAYRALASAYIQARNISGAETALGRLLELAPNDNVARINMGHVKYERGQVDEAVKLYEQAYAADSRRDDLLYTIASAYYLSGRYEEAIRRFDKVLEKDATHMSAQYYKADAALKLGKLDEAEKQFKALQEKMPDYRYIKLKLAYIRMLRGDADAADEVRSLMKSSDNPDDIHFGAVVLRKQGNVDESLAAHRKLREDHMDDDKYAIYLAREQLESHEYAQATEILMSLIDESVNNSLAWDMLSTTLLHQGLDAMMIGEFEQAHGFFEQALSMEVHPVEVNCSLAQLSLLEGSSDVAYEFFQAAEQISADDPNVVRLAAQFDIMDGAHQSAIARLGNLQTVQGDEAVAGSGWYLMAVAQSNLGQWDEAAKSLQKAEENGVVDSPALAIVSLQKALESYEKKDFDALSQQLSQVEKFKEGLDEVDAVRYAYLSAVQAIRDKKFAVAKTALESIRENYDNLDAEYKKQITPNGKLDISFELAYVYYETGNLDNALKTLSGNSSSAAKSLEVAIRRKLGYQALRNRKYDQAIENYNRLNHIGDLSVADQYNLVVARLEAKQLSNAAETLERYARQNIPEAVLNYAIYLDSAGNGVAATQYYEKYVSMTSARKSEDVRRMLSAKQRVWGSEHSAGGAR